MVTRVVHCKREPFDVPIGRPSIWSNRWSHRESTVPGVIYVATREEAIDNHTRWFAQSPEAEWLRRQLHTLVGKTLGCWCSPKPCHGDTLAMFADALYGDQVMVVIDSFRGQYAFLSNTFPCEIWLDDVCYPSVEFAYQAAKSRDLGYRQAILRCRSTYEVKALGKPMGDRQWHAGRKVNVMLSLMQQKYLDPVNYGFYGRMLDRTGDAELVEGNWWGDTFWGVCNGTGENTLGLLTMQVRVQWRSGFRYDWRRDKLYRV